MNIFKKDPSTLKSLLPAYFFEMKVGLLVELSFPKLLIFWLTNDLSTGSILLIKSMAGPVKMEYFTLICVLKIMSNSLNVAKLASSILAAINGNITSAARGKIVITNCKNAVSFSLQGGDVLPLSSPALPNLNSVSKKAGKPAPKAKPI